MSSMLLQVSWGKGQKLLAAQLINTLHCVFSPSSQQSEKESLQKGRDPILSILGEAKQDVIGLCPQVYKETILSQIQILNLVKEFRKNHS